MRFLKTIALLLLVLLEARVAIAHGGHGPLTLRTWSDSQTHIRFDAAFVLERDGTVLLRTPEEALVRTELNRLSEADRIWVAQRTQGIRALNLASALATGASQGTPVESSGVPVPVRFFEPFVPHVSVTWNDTHLVVESDGMPEHRMMVGVRAWNQQVPLPQSYRGDNAFRIPLQPRVAPESVPAPFLNAIAVAVNGVPIFHPIKQDGRTDTVVNGELDEFGGHAGRADDYHYHIAPRHLERIVGPGNPVAYSLDGYPIVVAKEENGAPLVPLDENHGHLDGNGSYAYYSTTAFPYLNISYRGVVDLENRPRALGVRPYTEPLPGAVITGFEKRGDHTYRLAYTLDGATNAIDYTTQADGGAQFAFIGADGTAASAQYGPARGSGKQQPGRRGDGPGGKRGGEKDGRRPGNDAGSPDAPASGPAPVANRSPRQPWILAHAAELDTNTDGAIAKEEVSDEANRAFDGYDANRDGTLAAEELAGGSNVRSAMGGFIKGHAREIDKNADSRLDKEELLAVANRMFDRIDGDRNGVVSSDELKGAERAPGQEATGGSYSNGNDRGRNRGQKGV